MADNRPENKYTKNGKSSNDKVNLTQSGPSFAQDNWTPSAISHQ